MTLDNKLGITDSIELAKMEEKISKKKAASLFESNYLEVLEPGSCKTLYKIHEYLFEDIYDFAGNVRTVNIAKGNFRFAPIMYLQAALDNIEKMPQSTFEDDRIGQKVSDQFINLPTTDNGRKFFLSWAMVLRL